MLAPSSETLEDASPLRELLTLAVPTVAQMGSYTVMQFIDGWMLSRLGTEPPTAVGNAGIFAFSFIAFGIGMLFVVNALASQEFGRKRTKKCGRWMWQGAWFSVAYAVLILPVLPLAHRIFSGFGHTPSLVAQEAVYFQIVLTVPVFKLTGVAAGQFLLATGRPATATVAAIAGVLANVAAAVPLVLGKLGVPSFGVAGAAWAQNVGVIVEALVLIAYALNGTSRRQFGATDWRLRPYALWKLVRIGFGTGLQVLSEVAAWSIFLVLVIARLGETAMAANQFMFRYMAVSFMPAFGISQAVTALVGRSIGAKRPDLAVRRAGLGYRVATVYMVVCGLLFVVFRDPLMRFFTADAAVQHAGAVLLVFAAVYQLFDAANIIYNGALRGVGDTFVPAIVVAGLCWTLNVGGGWLATRVAPQYGVAAPWTVTTTYGLILAVFAAARFHTGRWRTAPSNAGPDVVTLENLRPVMAAVEPVTD